MKKKYITPTAETYQIEVENICEITSPQCNITTLDEECDYTSEDGSTEFAAPSYRSNLWQ